METISIEIFNPKKAELQSIVDKYKGLEIQGVDDSKGYAEVHKARMELVKTRTTINKVRLEHTRQYDEAKRNIMDMEKELIGIIEPTEKELEEKEKAIDNEKARIKRESEEKENARIQVMMNELLQYGYVANINELKTITAEWYAYILQAEKAKFEEREAIRKEEEETERREKEEYERKRIEMEAKEKELQERERILREEQDKITRAIENKKREEEMERIRKEAEEKSRIETELRMKYEQEEKVRKEEEAKRINEENARIEQEKLNAKRKYMNWLKENGYTEDGSFNIQNNGKTVKLWKLVGEYII